MNPRFAGRPGWKRPPDSAPSPTLVTENTRLRAALDAAHAALETAEERERARFADDLHDILGHALEVVAFKAELADRVLDADASRAHGEMVEIQRVARSSMNDVRGLARCRRPTDLVAELADAVSLFDSAAVDVVVSGNACSVPEPARDPLARVLREAVTNVLRHARPTRCAITVTETSGVASLAVANDGVAARSSDRSVGGMGLAGLSRLVAEHGGRLCAGRDASGCFTLCASVASGNANSADLSNAELPHQSHLGAAQVSVPR